MLFAMSCVSYIQNEQMIAVKYACLPLQGFLASKDSNNDFFSQANIHLHVPEVRRCIRADWYKKEKADWVSCV